MFCPKCGNLVLETDAFCTRCGAELATTDVSTKNYDKSASQPASSHNTSSPIPHQARLEKNQEEKMSNLDIEHKDLDRTPSESVNPNFELEKAPPLPFFTLKLLFSVVSGYFGVQALQQAQAMGTLRLLSEHALDNIPGIPLLYFAVLCFLCTVLGGFTRRNRGWTFLAGTGYLAMVLLGVLLKDTYTILKMATAFAAFAAVVCYISAASIGQIRLDE